MKVLLFLFFLTVVKTEEFITMRLNDIAEKYRHQSWGNGEFSTWVERVFYAGRKPKGNKEEKKNVLQGFLQFDTQRQYLEDKITDRINEIESLLPNRQLSQICVTDYQAQKSRLQRAYKFSNSEKQRIIDANSKHCTAQDAPPPPPPPPPPVQEKKTEVHYIYEKANTYNYWYWWWWG
ncbi:uncharacterized protein LOC110181300 [Drosophila serrata]|uniref:uncharacterized protein LOC110179134 n=1 Tax=Drosophila serrata TaxID=7274 RepID=UPI000A1CF671|nr:uncharacterized protein LOC110179134 [Drosophila serrata]XP_020804680.1 uncharacterized protein LOC110181300 [Drosophila serrata]